MSASEPIIPSRLYIKFNVIFPSQIRPRRCILYYRRRCHGSFHDPGSWFARFGPEDPANFH